MDPDKITYFAETDARNKRVRFGIKEPDRLRHTYIIGKTGVGKSTLLENLAIQDIQNGNGIAFIDPHGTTAEKLLDYVPEHRIKDVLYFAPFDLEYPIAFNVLEDIGPDKRHLVVNGLMSTFEKIWVDAWSARMAYILNNTLLALLEYPGATLLGVNRMLSDKEYRRKVVDNIQDTSVKAFWVDEFGKWTEKFIAEAIPAIQNKVGQFTSNPLVRNLLGQTKSTFDIRKLMDDKKILIINMSKGLVGEGNASLLGSMMITKIYLAAMSRADKSKSELAKLPPFYLYVDEFQNFANKSFADILSEARKYKLGLIVANQYIEQMEEEVRNAVFGNAGTMITYRVGAFDAEVLEKEFAPTFMATDLVNLGKFQIYLKLMIDDVSSSPFSATALPPILPPEITFKNEVIKSSRDQFGRPRAMVEKDIIAWHNLGTSREVKTEFPSSQVPHPVVNSNLQTRSSVPNDRQRQESRPPVQQNISMQQDRRIVQNDKPKYSNNQQRQEDNRPRRENTVQQKTEELKIDENKQAFLRAQEELRRKEISISQIRKQEMDKKVPNKQNMASLKDALASVTKPKIVDNEKQKTKEYQSVKVEEKFVEQKNSNDRENKEIPEDVLRDLLK
jgi:hypothetical protein